MKTSRILKTGEATANRKTPAGHRRIAAILPLEMEYSSRLLEGALDYVRDHRRITLVELSYPVDQPNRLKFRPPFDFDAALIWATREATWVEDLLARGIPLIAASGDWPVERIPCVSFDGQALVESAVDHLAARSPASLLHLEFHLKGLPIKEGRARLFREAAARHGIPASSAAVFRPGEKDDSEFARRMPLQGLPARRLRELLRKLPKPAALWCGDDVLARRACEVAGALGLKIPEDLAILGLGDFRSAECGRPQISSVPLPGSLIGFHAFAALDRMLRGEPAPPPYSPVRPPQIIARESTAETNHHDPLAVAQAIILARCCDGITVQEVAAATGLSPQTFHARFVKRFGRSPGEEIRLARLEVAKRHLGDPRLSISRVAGLCGFNQQNKFSNFFRRETGLSPRDWRQAQ